MLEVFDRAFVRHLERITGTGEGIHGFSMGLVPAACIVLLTELAGEAEDSAEAGSVSRSELWEGLSEMGLDHPGPIESVIGEMARKGYVELDAQDRLLPRKPIFSMARLLDHAFPGMPGVNLVAYLVQTLDEVETGRKQPKAALLQLDQMLRHHGAAPFGRAKKEPEARPAPPRRPRLRRPDRLRAPTLRGITTPPAEKASDVEPQRIDGSIPEVEERQETPLPDPVEPPEPPSPRDHGPDPDPAPDLDPAPTPDPELDPDPDPVPNPAPDPDPDPDPGPDPDPDADPEAPVEDRVSAFEEELAMQCPVCRQASLEARQTAKGRLYYNCSDEQCMFISWGRPHHVPCPLCGNPFLVERDVDGDPKPLKCPRATCRYREPSPGEASGGRGLESGEAGAPARDRKPRRRVVRRKVRKRRR